MILDEPPQNYGLYLRCSGYTTTVEEGLVKVGLSEPNGCTYTGIQYTNVAYGYFSPNIDDEDTLPKHMLERPDEEVLVDDIIFGQALAAITLNETNFIYMTRPSLLF